MYYIDYHKMTILKEFFDSAAHYHKQLFPIGTFKGTFCSPEIERLLKDNCILEVGSVAKYKGEKIFHDYVTFFYEERLTAKARGDKINDELLKLFLNSLYGKFGQLKKNNTIIGECEIDEVWSKIRSIPEIIDGVPTGKDITFMASSR